MLRHPPTFTLFPYTTLFRSIMALARLDIPGLILYGGSIAPGQFEGHSVTIQDGDGMPLELTGSDGARSEEHTSELQSLRHLVCRLLLEKKKKKHKTKLAHYA